MKNKLMILGIVAMVVLFVGACSAALGNPKQTIVQISYDQIQQSKTVTREITVDKGTKIILELPSNPSTGYSWSKASIVDTGIIVQNESKYVGPEQPIPGAGGTQVWTFTASEKGTTTIKMEYTRPWETGVVEWTYQITVTVQ